ncbi:MAG TPA: TraB/GumN family protein [Burkholderiales bacterium]|nr:TraB/GumN family protein [Burkholderiales bacterium]
MRRRDFLVAGVAATAAPAWSAEPERFARGLLWRVTKPGATASHVYGTIHVADPRLDALPAPAQAAFERAASLMLEFLPDAYASERFAEAAMFLDRQTLEEKIGAEDFERALVQLRPIGLSREFVNKLKPWGVLLNLRDPLGAGGATPDGRLAAMARARRVPVFQIEGVEEQIFTFDELPMEAQVALLRHSLAHRDELRELADRTLEAYLAGDLRGIWRLRQQFMARHAEIAGYQAALTKRVVDDRNVVMAFRMQRELRRGSAFVALGALHLYGEKGVLALLEQDGWRTRRVY